MDDWVIIFDDKASRKCTERVGIYIDRAYLFIRSDFYLDRTYYTVDFECTPNTMQRAFYRGILNFLAFYFTRFRLVWDRYVNTIIRYTFIKLLNIILSFILYIIGFKLNLKLKIWLCDLSLRLVWYTVMLIGICYLYCF